MKIIIMGLLSSLVWGSAVARTLDTAHFRILINCLDSKSEAGCERASYDGTNKEKKATIHLVGRQLMQMCADKVTPCHSLGYEFTNGNTIYFISEDGHLKVTDGSKVLVDEVGEWTYD
ncbi:MULTISPECIES: hypothetical protein [Legionella]|uniref:Uncharacterized protein n=1 Tax=Legionella drozanskii LLAP-1 TaxID=1212489 RepID=A0A0W0SXI0_9GAMM|nr:MULTISPECIES: hypothetical protein [Legionella]KTC88004.1 hypothetical protein Ldro_1623 [Legionella drozanskii LLAP-1]PJE07330.1 MAG: hypothetical protein CK430_14025 [Legionella sp.]